MKERLSTPRPEVQETTAPPAVALSDFYPERASPEETVELLRSLGARADTARELVARDVAPDPDTVREARRRDLPLEDELHLAVWRHYAEAAATAGAVAVLERHLVQLSFPVAAGVSQTDDYRRATRQGVFPPLPQHPSLRDPDGIRLTVEATVGGALPVLRIPHRRDFETFVRVLSARGEPVAIPASMGACLVSGLVNWDRIRRHRAAWETTRAAGEESLATSWAERFRQIRTDKRLYQDRLVLLGSGDYSSVPAAVVGLEPEVWRDASEAIRLAHESAHYLTARAYGRRTSPWLGEVLADFAGLTAAFGTYSPDLALRLLGIDGTGVLLPDGRLRNYRGDPPLSEGALEIVGRLCAVAVLRLSRWTEGAPLGRRDPIPLARVLLHLGAGTLTDLAAGHGLPNLDTA